MSAEPEVDIDQVKDAICNNEDCQKMCWKGEDICYDCRTEEDERQ